MMKRSRLFQPHFRRLEGLDLLEIGFTPAYFGRNDPGPLFLHHHQPEDQIWVQHT